MEKNVNEDNNIYWKYTGPQRIDKAINVLKGILLGVAIDGVISNDELEPLKYWMKEYEDLSKFFCFNFFRLCASMPLCLRALHLPL